MGVSPSRREDKVKIVLKRADARLEEWFRDGQKATRKASAGVTAFLYRTKRQSAGALRHEVDRLQAGLKTLSIRLVRAEHEATPAPKKRRARPAPASKAVSSRKAASTRKRKKAA